MGTLWAAVVIFLCLEAVLRSSLARGARSFSPAVQNDFVAILCGCRIDRLRGGAGFGSGVVAQWHGGCSLAGLVICDCSIM